MYLRVSKALEQLDPALGKSSKRLYSELASAAVLWDRLDPLDEPIQFTLDQYELANTRLIDAKTAEMDHSHAMIGHVLEVGNHCAAPLSDPPILVTPTLSLTFHRDGGLELGSIGFV